MKFYFKIQCFLLLLIFNMDFSFYEEIDEDLDNYELRCDLKNCNNDKIHEIYKRLGSILFDKIWWAADILISLRTDMSDELIYYEMLKDIVSQYEDLLKINKEEKLYHSNDIKKLVSICKNILSHKFINNQKELKIAINFCIHLLES